MKVVILAGGYGTRLSEFTELIPKPMVTVAGKPIIVHIMEIYAKHGHTDFYLALGYKSQLIKEYFLNYPILNSDFTINLKDSSIRHHSSLGIDWKVTLIDTGLDTMTGGRIKKLKDHLGDEPFLLTYGDGLSDVNVNNVIDFHEDNSALITMTAVRPNARFGDLTFDGDRLAMFQEKPQMHDGWINGGFFVVQPEFLDLIDDDSQMLEREPLNKALELKKLYAFKHFGFWQCMDSKRDRDLLEKLAASDVAPWR